MKRLLFLFPLLSCLMADAALTPPIVITIRTNGVVDGPHGAVSTTGTTTAGIQEALNATRRAINFNLPGGVGVIEMEPAMNFDCTGPIVLSNIFPSRIVWRLNHSTIRYIGSTAQDFIQTSYNPSFAATNTLAIQVENGTFAYQSNYTQNIVNIGGGQFIRFVNTTFAKAGKIYGVNAFVESDYDTKPGLVGVFVKSSQNPMTYFKDCSFSGLACGINSQGDELIVEHCFFVGVGAYYSSGWIYNSTTRTTGKPSVGAAIIFDSNSGSCWALDNEYANVGCALYLPQTGIGVGGRCPLIRGGSIAGAYRILTMDKQTALVDSMLSGADNGDGIVTNNAAGLVQPMNLKPNTVKVMSFNQTNFYIGSTNTLLAVHNSLGHMTNGGRFSTLNGSALFDATFTTTTNFLMISGAGDAVLNGKYYPTNVPASLCTDANTLLWTNKDNGAYLIYDPGETCITDDDWEWRKNDGTLLMEGSPFGGTAQNGVTANGLSTGGDGTLPAATTVYLSTTLSQSSPKATLPAVIATNGFTGDASALTNLTAQTGGVTWATNATLPPGSTTTIRAWLSVTNDSGKVGKIPVYY